MGGQQSALSGPQGRDEMGFYTNRTELFRVEGQGQDGRRSLLFIFAAGSAGIGSWERVWVGLV